jgi:hypothetical protein
MMNHKSNRFVFELSIVCCAAMLAFLPGCGGGEAEQAAVAPPPAPAPAPPPPPAVTPIAQLMEQLNIDPRVRLPEERAPDNDVDRKAVLVFFDAFARGNAKSVKTMLPLTDQMELDALTESGAWQSSVKDIQMIDVRTGANSLGQKCALAVIEVGSGAVTSFQPQLWYFTADARTSLFEAAPTPPGIIDRLSGNWIDTWHKILAKELALADQPEGIYEIPKKNLDKRSPTQTAGNSAPRGIAPSNPGAAPAPSDPVPTGR